VKGPAHPVTHSASIDSTQGLPFVQASKPATSTQLAVAALGLLALPIVGWSEYELQTTGG
jgi:hypothetical protein